RFGGDRKRRGGGLPGRPSRTCCCDRRKNCEQCGQFSRKGDCPLFHLRQSQAKGGKGTVPFSVSADLSSIASHDHREIGQRQGERHRPPEERESEAVCAGCAVVGGQRVLGRE